MVDPLDRVLMRIRTQPGVVSPASWIASLPPPLRHLWLSGLSDGDVARLEYLWALWARTEQLPPEGPWRFWLFRGGRGGGKTRAGAEGVRAGVETGRYRRVALIAPTIAAGRQVMIEGPSGLLAVCPPWCRPTYEPSRQQLQWPNGAIATLFSADTPERLRGPQHDLFWADELCAWRQATYAWDMLLMGLRLGTNPRGIITTTPKPIPLYKQLLQDPTVVITTSSTFKNAANLAPEFFTAIIHRYQGTRLGRQELEAELIEDVEGALWRREWLQASRVARYPPLERIVVAVDPAVTGTPDAHETGIVVAGRDARGHVYVLADESVRASPDYWARRAVAAYQRYSADELVAEGNQGGELVRLTLSTVDETVSVRLVYATHGKRTRAEPVAALYEQGRVHHVGTFDALEDQLCLWDAMSGDLSPDRLDAVVWAVTELAVDAAPLRLIGAAPPAPDARTWFQQTLRKQFAPRPAPWKLPTEPDVPTSMTSAGEGPPDGPAD
jgi:phage terminase large subunit-like protein